MSSLGLPLLDERGINVFLLSVLVLNRDTRDLYDAALGRVSPPKRWRIFDVDGRSMFRLGEPADFDLVARFHAFPIVDAQLIAKLRSARRSCGRPTAVTRRDSSEELVEAALTPGQAAMHSVGVRVRHRGDEIDDQSQRFELLAFYAFQVVADVEWKDR